MARIGDVQVRIEVFDDRVESVCRAVRELATAADLLTENFEVAAKSIALAAQHLAESIDPGPGPVKGGE